MIPASVKIGAYTIKVIFSKSMMTDKAASGEYIPRVKEIHIDPDSCEEQQYGTFIHEVLEAITEIYEIPSLSANHHDLVLAAEGIHQFLRDNEAILPK